jgi:ubiquinone/menaquinone biosynthesis C-methylase UbiE
MQRQLTEEVVERTRDYYDSGDADAFYASVWGGEDIHIGIYPPDASDIRQASRQTVERMAQVAGPIDAMTRVIDIGAGYGGSARWLAERFGCHVCCFNLSATQNRRNEQLTNEQGLTALVEVHTGNFERLPFADQSFDLVWSQDAILHSGKRKQVLREAFRVLSPGGTMVFTDPMQSDDCPPAALEPVLRRIHLSSLASPEFYLESARAIGFSAATFSDLSENLAHHYSSVANTLRSRRATLPCSSAYVDRMLDGLQHWVDGGNRGHLKWGIFRFEKPVETKSKREPEARP